MDTTTVSLTLLVVQDTSDGVIHIDSSEMRQLSVVPGDFIAAEGANRVYLLVQPAITGDHNQGIARVSYLSASNLGLMAGQKVRLLKGRVKPPIAERIEIEAADDIDYIHLLARKQTFSSLLGKRVVAQGEAVQIPVIGTFPLFVKVRVVQPSGPVLISSATEFSVAVASNTGGIEIGGLREEFRRCISLLDQGVKGYDRSAVQSLLLVGPAGCGKATLVKKIAQTIQAELHILDTRKLIMDVLRNGGLDLVGFLTEVGKKPKTIILLDHLESLYVLDERSESQPVSSNDSVRIAFAEVESLLGEIRSYPSVLLCGVMSGAYDKGHQLESYFDFLLPVDLPNRWGRLELLRLSAGRDIVIQEDDCEELASASTGMPSRDIVGMIAKAKFLARGKSLSREDIASAYRSCAHLSLKAPVCDVPDVCWDEVVGIDDIKQSLSETIDWSLFNQNKFKQYGVTPPRSVLLTGGQGTGKTSLVKAVASHVPMSYIEISCLSVVASQNTFNRSYIRDVFHLARRKAPCMVFFDDFDSFFWSDKGEALDGAIPIVAQMMSELDRLLSIDGVIVIAATSRPDKIPEEILKPGSFSFALSVPLPDLTARKKMLIMHSKKLPLAADIDFDRLAANTHGMSVSEIAGLCNRVGVMALRQTINDPSYAGGMPVVTVELFDQALRGRKN